MSLTTAARLARADDTSLRRIYSEALRSDLFYLVTACEVEALIRGLDLATDSERSLRSA